MKSGWFDRTYFFSTMLTGTNFYSQALILPLIESCISFSTPLPRTNVKLIGRSCPSHLTHSLCCLLVRCILLPPNTIFQLFSMKREDPRGAASDSSLNPFLPKTPLCRSQGQAAAGPSGSTQHRHLTAHLAPSTAAHPSQPRTAADMGLHVSLHSHHLLHRFQLLEASFPHTSLQPKETMILVFYW